MSSVGGGWQIAETRSGGAHDVQEPTCAQARPRAQCCFMSGFDTLELLARTGYLVKGTIYIVIGALALQVAARTGGRITGAQGALTTVLGEPYGRTLLLVAAFGLFG